jgi:hypothetical protein
VAVLLTATHLGVTDLDVTSLVLALGAGVWAGPGLDLVNLRALLPTALPPGVYSFKLRVRDTGAQEALDTGTVTVP